MLARLAATTPPAAVPERAPTAGAAATALRVVTRRRTARGKLRALVEALNVLSKELGGAPAAEELLAALSETLAAAQLAAPHAEAAFVHAFCRDRSLLLGVEGYALTSLEVALATSPRPGVDAAFFELGHLAADSSETLATSVDAKAIGDAFQT